MDLVPSEEAGRRIARSRWAPEERAALVRRAYAGEKSVLPELRAMLEAHPEVVRAEGNLAQEAHLAMVTAVAGSDVGLPEVLARRAAQVQAELEGECPTALERLLCERVATCWLAVYLLDAVTIEAAGGKRAPERVLEQHERMKERAHRRYLEACVALGKVRRLLAPIAQQVNIAMAGARQVNVGASMM